LEKRKKGLLLHPHQRRSSSERPEESRGKGDEKFFKINLQETKKGFTFAPAITAKFFTYRRRILKEKKGLNFFSEKLARNKKGFYLCAPQDREFIERLGERLGRKKGNENF